MSEGTNCQQCERLQARLQRIRNAFIAWVESPHWVADDSGCETNEWLELMGSIEEGDKPDGK